MWEYLVLDRTPLDKESLPDALKRLGRDGWELCSILPLDGTRVIHYYFKRPLTALPDAIDNREVEAAKADWIEWRGGPCPVRAGALVEAKLRGCRDDYVSGPRDAVAFYWHHDGDGSDVVAYRVVKP